MSKIELIKKMLKDANKTLLKSKKRGEADLTRIRNIPNDEYNLDGDSEMGRLAKAEVIEGLQYHIGYVSGHDNLVDSILELLDMSEDEINQSLEHDKKIVKTNAATMKKLMKSITNNKKDDNADPHIQWCSAHGTGVPWAVDETCDCPGAYIIRKRMSEGMSYDDAKQWIIDNEAF